MNSDLAYTILNYIGKELQSFYDDLYFGRDHVKLLIDEDTFYLKCTEALRQVIIDYRLRRENITDLTYEDCLSAYDFVGTRFSYDVSKKDNVALAIAVYQVLLTYKKIQGDANQNNEGFYYQLKQNYHTLRNDEDFTEYFNLQEDLWYCVRDIFKKKNKVLDNFPEVRTGPNRYVQFPNSQRILESSDIHDIKYQFTKLDPSIDYTDRDFNELFSRYRDPGDFTIPLILNAYKSWKKHNDVQTKKYSGNSTDIGVLFFDENGTLYDSYGEYNIERITASMVYFYKAEDLWCTQVDDQECELGVLIHISQCDSPILRDINTEKINTNYENYVFLKIIGTLPKNSELYSKFYPKAAVKSSKTYKILNGVRLSNNYYLPGFIPTIKFYNKCINLTLTLRDTRREVYNIALENNVLNLNRYVRLHNNNQIFNGRITLSFQDNITTEPTTINLRMERPRVGIRLNCNKGWDLNTLAPCKQDNVDTLSGLYFHEVGNLSNINNDDELDNEQDENQSIKVDVPTPCIDCRYIGTIRINSEDKLFEKKSIIDNFLDRMSFGTPIAVACVLNELRDNNNPLMLDDLLNYYRLLKQCVRERYFDKNELFVIYYVSVSNRANNVDECPVKPLIQKVTYKEDFYNDNSQFSYFKFIQVNGTRHFTLDPVTISLDNISKSLKSLCKLINFQCIENEKTIKNDIFSTDFLEYYEVLFDPVLRITYSRKKDLVYSINLRDSKLSENREPAITFNFTNLQIYNDTRIIGQANSKLQTLQNRLYQFIMSKKFVTWQQIEQFTKEQELEDNNIFDLFFPLYNVGLIDVAWEPSTEKSYYYIPKTKIVTAAPYFMTIKSDRKFPNFKSYSNNINEHAQNIQELALKILKKIPSIEEIIKKNWDTIEFNDINTLRYGFDFGSGDGIDKPRFKQQSDPSHFYGLCRTTNDRRLMAMKPSYLKFPNGTIYQVPTRNNNPNAERMAKIVQRSFKPFVDKQKRFSYNKGTKKLTCHISDIPIPVLRALFICNILYLGNEKNYLNEKERNTCEFYLTDEIYSELKRILNKNLFEEN